MGNDDKLRNKGEEIGGAAKEKVGQATGDRDLQAEGKGDQTKANLKQAGEKVKDAFKD
ncbi:MAG: CsbD family protein [Oryzihumus sp.]